jgi:hypothetical protein
MQEVTLNEVERILARQVATEMSIQEIEEVSGGSMVFGTSYSTSSSGQADACDID